MKITFSFLKAAVVAFFIAFFSLTAQGVAHASAGDVMVEHTPPPPKEKEDGFSIEKAINLVQTFVDKMLGKDFVKLFIDSGLQISDKFKEWALALAGALALATMFWSVLMAWVQRSPIIDPVLEVLLYAAIAAFGINYYQTLITDIVALADGIIAYSGAGSIGGATQSFLQGMLHPLLGAGSKVLNAFGVLDIADIVGALVVAILALASVFFAIIAIKEILRVLLMGPLYLSVGLALGPLFVATLASGFTRRWFDQWLNFVISSSMLTAVTVLVLTIVGTVMRDVGINGAGADGIDPGTMLGYAMFCWSLSGILGAIPQMVDAIFPGRTGVAGVKPAPFKAPPKEKMDALKNAINKIPAAIGGFATSVAKATIGKSLKSTP